MGTVEVRRARLIFDMEPLKWQIRLSRKSAYATPTNLSATENARGMVMFAGACEFGFLVALAIIVFRIPLPPGLKA
jgi:hypothetical protein